MLYRRLQTLQTFFLNDLDRFTEHTMSASTAVRRAASAALSWNPPHEQSEP